MKIMDMEWLRRNRQPLWVFALYFVSIAGFGGVYWRLYYTNNANFWFNEDIYKSQYSAARNLYEREFREEAQAVALLTGELDAVNTVDSDFRKGLLSESADREGTTVRSPSGYIMRLQEMIIHSVSGGPAPPAYRISISDPKGKLITNEVISILEQPNTTETFANPTSRVTGQVSETTGRAYRDIEHSERGAWPNTHQVLLGFLLLQHDDTDHGGFRRHVAQHDGGAHGGVRASVLGVSVADCHHQLVFPEQGRFVAAGIESSSKR